MEREREGGRDGERERKIVHVYRCLLKAHLHQCTVFILILRLI